MENIKKFSSKGISITREDYESLPLPMYAYEFNDAFWIEMEECAVAMGMRYYSDIKK